MSSSLTDPSDSQVRRNEMLSKLETEVGLALEGCLLMLHLLETSTLFGTHKLNTSDFLRASDMIGSGFG